MIFKTIHTAASLIALAQYLGAQVASLVYLNGSTDYVELYAHINSSGTLNIAGGADATAMSGHLVRAA